MSSGMPLAGVEQDLNPKAEPRRCQTCQAIRDPVLFRAVKEYSSTHLIVEYWIILSAKSGKEYFFAFQILIFYIKYFLK